MLPGTAGLYPKVLVLAGSDRPDSPNRMLAQAAVKALGLIGAEVTLIALADYPLPLFDGDGGADGDPPDNATRLAGLFAAHDALFVACPEINASIAPGLKNALDWAGAAPRAGRRRAAPFDGLTVALASAGPRGGVRALDHLRAVFVSLGAQIVSEQCIVSGGVDGFGDDGMPADERAGADLDAACRALVERCPLDRGR